jgi:hypothetical protein
LQFKYANFWEIVMMLMGLLMAMATGLAQPLNILVFGETINKFIGTLKLVR